MKILVVDDEKVLVKGIKFNLESEGYQVEAGYDGEEAVELARNGAFDLIILDLMMPKIDGLQACMRIREFSNVPVIMLTARSEDTDKIIGFECGADDYITKPFNILELKARVRALLRRAGMAAQKQGGGGRLSMGHITLDVDARAAWKDGKSVDLTAKEFDLMELLLRNPGRVYSRENLLNVVWGYEYAGDYRTVDVHVRRLREKLEKNLGGIKNMTRVPDAIFVVDPKKERICVQEAHALGITLIGIGDTNCDPEELDYIIPGNDDAIRAVKLIVSKMADAVIEAKQGEAVYSDADVATEAEDIEEVAADAE